MYLLRRLFDVRFRAALTLALTALLPLFLLGVYGVHRAAAAFDPSNIIPDAEFTDVSTMSEAQTQSFLEAKGGGLAGYTESSHNGIGPNDDVDPYGWTAAHIIWQAANWYGINPQVILTTLQKEQSLVTTAAPSQAALDWAMGFGCPDASACNTTYQGFARQVDYGAWQLRYNMDHANAGDRAVAPYLTGNTVPIDNTSVYLSNGATASLYRYTPHLQGNENFYNIYNNWFQFSMDSTAPAAGATGAYTAGRVTATFSKHLNPPTVTSSSFKLTRHQDGSSVMAPASYDDSTKTAFLSTDGLDPNTVYDATLTTAVSDLNGNHLGQDYTWSFTTGPPAKRYYFPWYDSTTMQDWVLMANPAGSSTSRSFDLSIGGASKSLADPFGAGSGIVPPGRTLTFTSTGVMDGPVRVASQTGDAAVVSQRSLMGSSFEEVPGADENTLSDRFFWPWYDNLSPGMTNWVLVANPSTAAKVHAVVSFTNRVDGSQVRAESDILPGSNWNPTFPGRMGGPVKVEACYLNADGTPNWNAPAKVMASQRVLSNYGAAFNELPGIPGEKLSDHYLWTWYDSIGSAGQDWMLLSNPGSGQIYYEITIAGQDPGPGSKGIIGQGQTVTPTFPGRIGGPVEVKACYTGAGGAPDWNSPAAIIASQRTVWGPSFEEVPGFPYASLTSDYHWTWYDMASPGAVNWILVANPGSQTVHAQVTFTGTGGAPVSSDIDIPAGQSRTPTFPGKMGGPVQVTSTGGTVMVSQRVIWNGYFNEVLGQ